MVDHKDNAAWTLNEENTFQNIGMIDINDLNPSPAQPAPVYKSNSKGNTDALDRWVAEQGKMSSLKKAMYVVMFLILIGMALVTLMVADANAGQALMWFEVQSTTDKTIIVVDEYDTFLTFHKTDITPDLKKGDEVMVVTDLKMVNGKWEMNRSRTAIMDIVK